jgi:hypothetical protein
MYPTDARRTMKIVNILPLHSGDVSRADCSPLERAYLRSCFALFESQGSATLRAIHVDDAMRGLDWWAASWMDNALVFLHERQIIHYAHIGGTGRFAPFGNGKPNAIIFDTSLSGTEIARRVNAPGGQTVAEPPEVPCCLTCGAPRRETWDGGKFVLE